MQKILFQNLLYKGINILWGNTEILNSLFGTKVNILNIIYFRCIGLEQML